MRREGADEDNLSMADFLCDFCGSAWTDTRPMIEGHRGACLCGPCLTLAYADLEMAGVSDEAKPGETCRMCLEERTESCWRSPVLDDAIACRRCVKQAAGAMHKDPDTDWWKPGREPDRPSE